MPASLRRGKLAAFDTRGWFAVGDGPPFTRFWDETMPVELRVGIGFDLHRLVRGRPFVLGGLRLPHPLGPLGHSDGDALLHALTDALLGATGGGDIGDRFPDTDPRWKGADSRALLGAVWSPLRRAGWRVCNVDATVVAERPKLGPWKPRIAREIARLLGVPADRVCVKAKTLEKLGPIGKGKAVAAQVAVLLNKSSR
jgi:2-C-methyl-D-erythritol 2,4-cyclodiphosphate synthase